MSAPAVATQSLSRKASRNPTGQRPPRRSAVIALRVGACVLFFGGWLYLQGPGDMSPVILPNLEKVFLELGRFLTTGQVYQAALVTLGEILGALAIAATLGFAVGFWGARKNLRSGVLEPLLIWGYLVPTILFYPLFLLWLGFGTSSKIGYAAVSAFFPIAYNCLRAYQRVEPRYIQVGRAFGASARQLDWQIKFRGGLPLAAAGLKLGAAQAIVSVIVAEMLASSQGLGFLIQLYAQSFRIPSLYAIIVIVLVVVGILHVAVKLLLREDAPVEAR
ncbi:MAG: hypothetical protein JWP85_1643 [Rhodoglobus sp.]|nr:hypothetical protein [Rhodoglobus sp.]